MEAQILICFFVMVICQFTPALSVRGNPQIESISRDANGNTLIKGVSGGTFNLQRNSKKSEEKKAPTSVIGNGFTIDKNGNVNFSVDITNGFNFNDLSSNGKGDDVANPQIESISKDDKGNTLIKGVSGGTFNLQRNSKKSEEKKEPTSAIGNGFTTDKNGNVKFTEDITNGVFNFNDLSSDGKEDVVKSQNVEEQNLKAAANDSEKDGLRCDEIDNSDNTSLYPSPAYQSGMIIKSVKNRTFQCRDPPQHPEYFYKLVTEYTTQSKNGMIPLTKVTDHKYVHADGSQFYYEENKQKGAGKEELKEEPKSSHRRRVRKSRSHRK